MNQEIVDKIIELATRRGVIRPRDVEALGLPRRELGRMRDAGLLTQPARGLYILSEYSYSENMSLAEATSLVPRGVICLLSALQYHDLTTQVPHQVWIALQPADWQTSPGRLPLKIVRFSGPAYSEGIETHVVDGVDVRIYSPAKTVADCFKYRNKIGLDIALESLRDCWLQKKCSIDDLVLHAKHCRVQNVMRPYLESLV